MKRTLVFILALTLVFSATLSGCGANRVTGDKDHAVPTPAMTDTLPPAAPDPEDGVVRDEDGVITEDDTGKTGRSYDGRSRGGMSGNGSTVGSGSPVTGSGD